MIGERPDDGAGPIGGGGAPAGRWRGKLLVGEELIDGGAIEIPMREVLRLISIELKLHLPGVPGEELVGGGEGAVGVKGGVVAVGVEGAADELVEDVVG